MTAQIERQTQALVGANEQLSERRAFIEAVLESARTQAGERVLRMRAGDVRHDPSDAGFCEKYCEYGGICRVRA